MASHKLRKIIIDYEVFLWRRQHFQLIEYKQSKAVERLAIDLKGYKKSAVQIRG